MSFVFVVDQDRKPLAPVHPGRARFLLTAGHAAVLRRYPFTIILKEAKPDAQPHPLRGKLDPGSKTTGIAIVADGSGQVVWAAELAHRGDQVKAHLDQRRGCRRSRRQRHTRYRPARFNNRTRPKGWLPPSLQSRIENILTWLARLRRWCPLGAISLELVKFATQLMQHAEVSGIEYQHGTLQGCEVRAYLLEKWQHRCADCGATLVPLEVEHIVPKATSVVGGFRTGDMVRATVPASSTKAGVYVGRIAIRVSGSCDIKTGKATIQGIHYRYCQSLHRGDGYTYTTGGPPSGGRRFLPIGVSAPRFLMM